MKKTLLSLIMLTSIGIYSSQAQITLNSSHIVGQGDVVEQAKDTILSGITIGSSGPSQTWNFSSLAQDELDTMSFKNPGPLTGYSSFPLSNLGMEDTSQDSTWMFLTKNGLGLFVDGIAQYQQGNLVIIPLVTTIITFPSTMGTNYSGNWNGLLFTTPVGLDPDGPGPTPIIDSVKVTRSSTLTSNIDAWGNVTTPFGTFASLRQNVSEENIDTTWTASGGTGVWVIIDPAIAALLSIDQVAYDTTRTARWWTDDPVAKFPIVEMDYEANGTVNSISWQKSTPSVGVAEQVKNLTGVSLYPNPAKNEITIETSLTDNNNIEILDVTGKLVSKASFSNNKITLSVADLENGIYFYNIYDVNGNVLHSNKFVVAN